MNSPTCKEPAKLTLPVVLLSHNVPILVVTAPLTVTVPELLKVIFAGEPLAGPVTLVTAMLPAPESPTVSVTPLESPTLPKVIFPPAAPMVRLDVTFDVRALPKFKLPPATLILPVKVLAPSPVILKNANGVFDPTDAKATVPEPAATVSP